MKRTMQFEKDFKEALSLLPEKEKDKLILRLLKKDIVLAERLHFELVSDQTVEEKRREFSSIVKEKIGSITSEYYSIGSLLSDMRYLSAEITHHVKVTKDKYGEIELNLMLLTEILDRVTKVITVSGYSKAYKFSLYTIQKTFRVLILIHGLDPDYQEDFASSLEKLGALFSENAILSKMAIDNGLEFRWLLLGEIPEDIKEIHAFIKSQGLLR